MTSAERGDTDRGSTDRRGTSSGNAGGRRRTRAARASAGGAVAIVLVVVLALALALGDREAARVDEPARADSPVIVPSDATSASWYCSAGTSTPDGYADETVRITNLGDGTVDAIVRVLPGRDEEPAEIELALEAGAVARVDVADVLVAAEPGVVVEVYGGDVFVDQLLRNGDDTAVTPCANRAATEWSFAMGTTLQGAQQYLSLFNPFSEDASVDISFVTESGFAQPERLQGFTVPRTSRVTIPVHDEISRSELVATRVGVRIGRVVAEQVLVLDGSDTVAGRQGIAASLGASSLGREWFFPWAGPVGGTDSGIAVANFGTESGELTISVTLEGEATLEDQTVPIPPRTVTMVDVAARVPNELGASVRLRTSPGVEVVAEQFASASGRIATMVGRTEPAVTWLFTNASNALEVVNPGDETVEVVVRSVDGDEVTSAEVPGRDRVRFSSSDLDDLDGPAVLEATGPVVAVRVGSLNVSPGVVGADS